MSNTTVRRLTAALFAGLIMLTACSSSSDELKGKLVTEGTGCQPSQVARTSPAPTITPVAKEPTKLVKKDLVKGKGCPIASAPFVTIDLVGATAVAGTQFVDTYGKPHPINAQIGTSQLLTGLDDGLAGMKVGGQREIIVPAAMAYGKDGNADQKIGKNQGLIFIVNLVAVADQPTYCSEATVPATTKSTDKPTTVDMPVKAPTKTTTKVLKKGDGPVVTAKSYVTVSYLGVACSTGQQFDSSWDRGETFTAALTGTGDPTRSVIPGWTSGLVGQTVGSLVQVNIPSSDAYGKDGQGNILPNEDLVFVIKIVDSTEKAPAVSTTTVPGGDTSSTTTTP